MSELKDRIKMVRTCLHLTQAEFGAIIGVKGNTIGNYETDLRKPSEAVIFSICREFAVNETWLRTGEGKMFTPKTRDEEIAAFLGKTLAGEEDAFQKRFVSMLAKLNVEEWALLEKMVKGMLDE